MHHHVLFGFKVILGIFVSIALALAFFYIGFNTGYLNGLSLGQNQGWLAAKQTVEESGLFPPPPAGVKTLSLSGTVKNIEGNKIFLETANLNLNPLDKPTPTNRIVTVTDNTKLIKQILKTPEELQTDLGEFRKAQEEFKPEEGAAPPTPPLPYNETNFNINDLKAGDSITVNSQTDIRAATEFKATEIRWQTPAETAPVE